MGCSLFVQIVFYSRLQGRCKQKRCMRPTGLLPNGGTLPHSVLGLKTTEWRIHELADAARHF